MYDINRPLRRLEVAQRIQELRDKATAEHLASPEAATDAAAVVEPAERVQVAPPVEPVQVAPPVAPVQVAPPVAPVQVAPPVAPAPVAPAPVAPAPVAPAQPPADVAPELPVQRVHSDGVVPSAEPASFADVADDSAAAAIASLLRGGQTWLLNPDERQHRESH